MYVACMYVACMCGFYVVPLHDTSMSKERREGTTKPIRHNKLFPYLVPYRATHISLLQTFLLKVTTSYDNGRLFVTKSVPCEAGSSSEVCIVEVRNSGNDAPLVLTKYSCFETQKGALRAF